MLGQKPNTLSNPMRLPQAMNTTTLRACRRTGYEGCDLVSSVLRLAKIRDSAEFPRSGSIESFIVCVEAGERLHSRLRETKGVESINPFGLR